MRVDKGHKTGLIFAPEERMITFHAPHYNEEELALAIASLLYLGNEVECEKSGRWRLDPGNNFWLHPLGGEKFRLDFRHCTKERLEAFAVMLEWRLGVRVAKMS